MIYPRLVLFGTRVTGGHDPDQVPDTIVIEHEGPTGVTLTRIPSPKLMTSAHHLLMDPDVDPTLPVPGFTDCILDHRDCNVLQHFWP